MLILKQKKEKFKEKIHFPSGPFPPLLMVPNITTPVRGATAMPRHSGPVETGEGHHWSVDG